MLYRNRNFCVLNMEKTSILWESKKRKKCAGTLNYYTT